VVLRDLYSYKVAGCETLRDAEALTDLLIDHGIGTLVEECPPGGGHRRKVFRLHAVE
jgi:hypothetical protein